MYVLLICLLCLDVLIILDILFELQNQFESTWMYPLLDIRVHNSFLSSKQIVLLVT